LDFKEALLLAQQLGFAESNPKLDIEGFDAVNKWSLLLLHAYGIVAHPDKLLFNGIQNLNATDAQVAANNKQQIKLIAQAKKLKNGKVAAFVLPQFISVDDNFAFAKNEYNAVVLESGLADKQFFLGKGAGAFPTASAVLSDIAALRYDYKYEYKKLNHHDAHELTGNYSLKVYISFTDLKHIVQEDFVSIDQWHRDERRSYVIGEIAYETLLNNTWWKENGNSLILQPVAINEEANVQSLKKKSLILAGALI
jgi:homoserine dehydrogenase